MMDTPAIPADVLDVLLARWKRQIEAGSLSAEACVRQLDGLLRLPNAPQDMQTLTVALDIFGRDGAEILSRLQGCER